MTMTIKVDKEYTEKMYEAQVREDIKEFKERYTATDILRWFADEVGWVGGYTCEILKAEAKAFPGGWVHENRTSFMFDMVLEGRNVMYKVHFYIDMDLTVSQYTTLGNKMYSIQRFVLA